MLQKLQRGQILNYQVTWSTDNSRSGPLFRLRKSAIALPQLIGTAWPASTQMYSHARLPARATTAAGTSRNSGKSTSAAAMATSRPARRRRGRARRARTDACTGRSESRGRRARGASVGLGAAKCSSVRITRCASVAEEQRPARARAASAGSIADDRRRRAGSPRCLRRRPARADRASGAIPARDRAPVPARRATRCTPSPRTATSSTIGDEQGQRVRPAEEREQRSTG